MGEVASPLWQSSDVELVEALAALETRMRQNYSAMLDLVSELDSRRCAGRLGYSNTAALLVHALRISRGEARQRISQAEQLHEVTMPTGAVAEAAMPLTAAGLKQGTLGVGHVEVIQKTLDSMRHLEQEQRAWAEELMVAKAADDDPGALARYGARYVREMVDPDGTPPPDEEPQRPERELRRHLFRDGRMEFKGRLDAEAAALFEALLAPFDKRDSDDMRSYAERGGDAFADVLQKAANAPDLPTHNGLKTEVAFTISLDALERALGETILPGNLSVSDARRIACDCHVLPAVMGGASQPLDVASPAYVVPAHIRRALVLRDRGCSFPGCDRPASVCHAHHIQSWLKGGPTELRNLTLLCGQHHRLIHRSEWEVELVNDVPYFTPPAYVDPAREPRRNRLHHSPVG
ncbi:hypothetical protein JOF56_011580 [Kibdelosporangium banguiense]|uniref:HNH nuclease domain-containing protein n=1 Tax=Kibdelosporangium banguiense TaxID=1365924 RepID=A0ABS4U3J9_9PSEU|nr:HNH endonuclease signature motif containing protein [Kibdelosporangium banguiense]MBP2331195.1 hypothetical protein [Kibdelosporangium banguiense]